ncbi:hypothetical protein MAM1_0012d01246 [Mucor ambiguus]|uniref:Uncharacterized protein n=1 Tax=Mucor ambiguus TaxID=91626 RepID=A0A0C9M0V3_9FUNG|nr:hypothetical protein MAM1_0012d01246 [Mucor ambiguus]
MSSDNQTTPITDNEISKDTSEAPAAEPSNNSNSSNAIDVHALKERIIATNKLFKYLSDAKNELAAREAQIATLNTNLGLSIKSLQESDDKCKKLAEQVQALENQLKAKSVQFDALSEANKKLKSDLKTQADLAKRMGSSAAEFRIAKDQVTKLTQETAQLKEALSKLQAEKDQLDEDAMETSINHNLTVESLQEEIDDLKSSLTTDDSAVVSQRLQLEMEQKKVTKANAHIKALEERLGQAHEQIKQLQLDKSRSVHASSQISQANMESTDQMKRVHAEEVASLKRQIQQLNVKLERKVAAPPVPINPPSTTTQQHPDLTKKYHKLQAEYQFIKRTNAFLEQELRRALENEAEQRGFVSDNDVEDVDMDDAKLLSPPQPALLQATPQKSIVLPPKPSASTIARSSPPRESVAKSREPRIAHQQQQQQQQAAAEELLLQQKSGLIAPVPQANTTKSVKKRKSLLEKFATSKNPSKVLERAASNTPVPTVSKKRIHNEVEGEDQAATASSSSTSTPASEANATTTTAASASKRSKPDYHLNHVLEELFNKQILFSAEKAREILPGLLEEIQDCYARIKSIAVFADTELVEFGNAELQLPKSMDQREKLYAWFLVSLFKINRDAFDQFMSKLAKAISHCPPAKTPLNHKLIRLVRLFIAACKIEASFGRLRSLIYGLFRTKAFHSSIIPILLNAGVIWKESFMFEATEPQFTSLPDTFVSSIYFISCNSSSVKNMSSMYEQLSNTFRWPSKPKPLLECVQDAMTTLQSDYFKQLHTEDKDKFDLLSYNLITSFELAFIVLDDWNQTYDVFIRTSLWPLLNTEVVDVVAMELLGVLAKLGISSDPTKPNKPGVVTLLNTFSTIIKLGEDIDPNEKHLQFAASRAMATAAGCHRDYRKFLNSINDI